MESNFLFHLTLGVAMGRGLGQGMEEWFAPSTPGAGELAGMLLSSLGVGKSQDGKQRVAAAHAPKQLFLKNVLGTKKGSVLFTIFGHSQPFAGSFSPHC